MIKCIIIDDEKPSRNELKFHISNFDSLKLLDEFDNTEDAYCFLKKHSVQLLFLDIHMPGEDGIEFAKKIINEFSNPPKIIFVTAYDTFAIDAFELKAVDYILKPIKDDRFIKSISRIIDSFSNELESKRRFITLSKKGELYPINKKDIKLVSTQNGIVIVHTTQGIFELNCTLSSFEKKLTDASFLKVHRSYIINLNYIERIIPWFNSTYNVKLVGIEENIPISRGNTATFKERMSIL